MTDAIRHVMLELAPWLLLGALIAGLLHVLLPAGMIRRRLRGKHAVWQSVAMGVPLPLCSCGVIPAGIGLKKDGASNGAAIGFLISTPQTGVDSIMVSAALLGWPFAMFKVAIAAVMGLAGGVLADVVADDDREVSPTDGPQRASPRSVRAVLSHGIEVIRSVWVWLIVGILVSGAIEVWLPPTVIGQINTQGGSLLSAIVALAISLPMYVCAISSVPIAAALVAKGLPAGAALVFLMAGPATNVATIGAIFRTFGTRSVGVYLGTIIVGSLGAAVAFDWLLPTHQPAEMSHPGRHSPLWLAISSISAVLLAAMFTWFTLDEVRRWVSKRGDGKPGNRGGYQVDVDGMTCQDCVRRLEAALTAEEGVQSARVQLRPGKVIVRGTINESLLNERIRATGFQPTHSEALPDGAVEKS